MSEKIKLIKHASCYGGLDLAKISDTSALVLTFQVRREKSDKKDERRFHMLPYFWIPEEKVNELEKEFPALPIRAWCESGHMKMTEGNVTDYRAIKADILALNKVFRIERIAFDPWNAESLTQDLEAGGIERVEFRQTMANYAEPTAEFERLLKAGLLTHANNPVLNWQAKNATVITDTSGNFRPVKPPHEDHRKVDGIQAGIMSLNEAMLAPPPFSGNPLIG